MRLPEEASSRWVRSMKNNADPKLATMARKPSRTRIFMKGIIP